MRLTGAILGALYSDLRDTSLVVRALCHFRSHFLGAVRPVLSFPNIVSGNDCHSPDRPLFSGAISILDLFANLLFSLPRSQEPLAPA